MPAAPETLVFVPLSGSYAVPCFESNLNQCCLTKLALQITPNSSIHILAKSSENINPNASSDWIDLKEKTDEDAVSDAKAQQGADANRVQHEVAALRMAQGLLKGVLHCFNGCNA